MRIHRWLGTASSLVLAAVFAMSGGATLAASKVGVASAVKNRVDGTVGNRTRPLVAGSDVFVREVVRTGEASTAQLLLLDETSLSIGPQSEITLDRFVFDPNRKAGSVVLNASRGAFRFISGSQQSSSYQIKTPVANIGVRGSIFDLLIGGIVPNIKAILILVEGIGFATLPDGQTVELTIPGQAIELNSDGTWRIFTYDSTIFHASNGDLNLPLFGNTYRHQIEILDGRIDLMDQLLSGGPRPDLGGGNNN
jgi:hypothetical protein